MNSTENLITYDGGMTWRETEAADVKKIISNAPDKGRFFGIEYAGDRRLGVMVAWSEKARMGLSMLCMIMEGCGVAHD